MKYHGLYGEQIVELMQNAAPRLRELVVMLTVDALCPAFTAPYLSSNTLNRNAPDLRLVGLRNVYLPPSGQLPASANVTTLIIFYWNLGRITEIESLWPCCPALREMVVSGPVIISPAACADHQPWRSLQYLDVNLEVGCATELFLRASLHEIPGIRARSPNGLLTDCCLQHLDGELEVACGFDMSDSKVIGQYVDISFTAVHSGRFRIFTQLHDAWLVDSTLEGLRYGRTAERITALSLPDNLWPLVSSVLPPLENLASLRLLLTQSQPLKYMATENRYPLCPNVTKLTLWSYNGIVAVSYSELSHFVRSALLLHLANSPQITLVLEGVDLHSKRNVDADASLFKEL